ncbi:MAG: hypothetical protein AAFV80_21760, partial [Bacteroidota bacterium]
GQIIESKEYRRLVRNLPCTDWIPSNSVLKAVVDIPTAPFTGPTETCEGYVNTFVSTSALQDATYTWDFGVGASPATAVGEGPHDVVYSIPGTHSISLTVEKDGCSASSTEQIYVEASPIINALLVGNATCNEGGNILILMNGPPVFFEFNIGNGWQLGALAHSNLPIGDYHIQVRSTSGLQCVVDTMIIITGPPALSLDGYTTVDEAACLATNGKIEIALDEQGTAPYWVNYTFAGADYQQGPFATPADLTLVGLAPGTYTNIIVSDQSDCTFLIEEAVIGEAPCQDTDEDGVPDIVDIDDDNDGLLDTEEVCGSGFTTFFCTGNADPSEDMDNDGIPNYQDNDFCVLNAYGICRNLDWDGDGMPDYLDLDSDNDGIPDLVDGGGDPSIIDQDGNAVVDGPDTDGDGLLDIVDNNDNDGPLVSGCTLDVDCNLATSTSTTTDPNFTGTPAHLDTDGDGRPDFIDLDADNDGIADIVEAGFGNLDTNGDGYFDADDTNGTDTDGDGLAEAIDGSAAFGAALGTMNKQPNTDQHGAGDWIDLDSDNDGIADIVEGGHTFADTNKDGVIDSDDTDGSDSDGDGLMNAVDGDNTSIGAVNNTQNDEPDTDGDGQADWIDLDSDNDGISDLVESGKGILD